MLKDRFMPHFKQMACAIIGLRRYQDYLFVCNSEYSLLF